MFTAMQPFLERRRAHKEAETVHRRAMELAHGWKPNPHAGPSTVSYSTNYGMGGLGFALAAFFIAVAITVVGVSVAAALADPQELVTAYRDLYDFIATRDLTASR